MRSSLRSLIDALRTPSGYAVDYTGSLGYNKIMHNRKVSRRYLKVDIACDPTIINDNFDGVNVHAKAYFANSYNIYIGSRNKSFHGRK